MTCRNLTEFLADEQRWPVHVASRRLSDAALHVERCAFSSPQLIDYLIGKTCFLGHHDPARELDCAAQHVGYALELDDHQTAVIALRRMTARGA